MQFKTIFAALALATAASAIEIDFYLGANCHGQRLSHSSVHEVYHNYNAPTNTRSMTISGNGLNRKIIATDAAGCRGDTGTADEFRGNGCFTARNVGSFTCYSLHE